MYSRVLFSKLGLKIFISPVEVKIVPIYVGGRWGHFPKDGEAAFPLCDTYSEWVDFTLPKQSWLIWNESEITSFITMINNNYVEYGVLFRKLLKLKIGVKFNAKVNTKNSKSKTVLNQSIN